MDHTYMAAANFTAFRFESTWGGAECAIGRYLIVYLMGHVEVNSQCNVFLLNLLACILVLPIDTFLVSVCVQEQKVIIIFIKLLVLSFDFLKYKKLQR